MQIDLLARTNAVIAIAGLTVQVGLFPEMPLETFLSCCWSTSTSTGQRVFAWIELCYVRACIRNKCSYARCTHGVHTVISHYGTGEHTTCDVRGGSVCNMGDYTGWWLVQQYSHPRPAHTHMNDVPERLAATALHGTSTPFG